MSIENSTILLIDDTPPIRYFMRLTLEEEGAECIEASNMEDGIHSSEKHKPDMIVLDMDLPDDNLFQHIQKLKQTAHAPNIIALTARREKRFIDQARDYGADATINKPFSINDLLDVIENVHNPLN